MERVETKGEMSVRGGILDLFPLTSENAIRIELFDVDVDSIRTFDVSDQRSIDKLESITIPPCREIQADRKRLQSAAQHAYELLQAQLEKMSDRTAKDKLLEGIGHDIELLREGQTFPGIYKYISLLYTERQTLMDYMPKDAVLIIDEPPSFAGDSETARTRRGRVDDACADRGEELAGFCAVQILRNTAASQTVSNVIFISIPASGRWDSTAKYRELRESRYAKFPRADEFAQSGDGALEEKWG